MLKLHYTEFTDQSTQSSRRHDNEFPKFMTSQTYL